MEMMIPRFQPFFDEEEIRYFLSCQSGKAISEFEKKFAKLVGSRYAVAVPYARTGLYALLKSLKIKQSEILVPSYTCAAIPSVVIASGNIVRFCRVSLRDYNILPEDAFSRITNKTKVLIPIHMYGYPANVKALREEVDEEILIFEDAGQGLLTKGVGKYGDAAFYSFGLYKQIFACGGGMITTNNKDIHQRLCEYIDKNFKKQSPLSTLRNIVKFFSTYFIFDDVLYKITDIWIRKARENFYKNYFSSFRRHIPSDFLNLLHCIQAKIGLAQIKKAKDMIKRRIEIARFYDEELHNLKEISLPPIVEGATYAYYTVRVKKRTIFEERMHKKGVAVDKFYHYSVPYRGIFRKYADDKFPNSLLASKTVVNLPIYPSLADDPEKMEQVVKAVKKSL